jgi:hypothetical protein
MVSSPFTVYRNGVGVSVGVSGIVIWKVAVGACGLGVIVRYGVSTPEGVTVGVGCTVTCLQPLNKSPVVIKTPAILWIIDPDYTNLNFTHS